MSRIPFKGVVFILWDLPAGSNGKQFTCNAGDLGLIFGLGRSPGGGNGNPLQYSRLENPMDRGTWWAIVHAVAESDTTEWLTLSPYIPSFSHHTYVLSPSSSKEKRIYGKYSPLTSALTIKQ